MITFTTLAGPSCIGGAQFSAQSCRLRYGQTSARAGSVKRQKTRLHAKDESGGESSLEDELAKDIERLRAKKKGSSAPGNKVDSAEKGGLGSILQTLLVVDFFVVLFFLGWLAIAVVKNDDDMYKMWYSLWDTLIQPALGVLMLGTLVSGVRGWLRSKSSS